MGGSGDQGYTSARIKNNSNRAFSTAHVEQRAMFPGGDARSVAGGDAARDLRG
jgi:hypothetical protein